MVFSLEGGEPAPRRNTPEEIAANGALKTISRAGWGEPDSPGRVTEQEIEQAEQVLFGQGFQTRDEIRAAVRKWETGR
jgi:hypothetical protein